MPKSRKSPFFVLLLLLAYAPTGSASAGPVAFNWQLRLEVNVGAGPNSSVQLPPLSGTGIAQVSGGALSIAPGEIVAAIPTTMGFGGTISNGAGTFSSGAVSSGFACPSNAGQIGVDTACVSSGGFGGLLSLSGLLHLGQGLSLWGLGGTNVGQTSSGLFRALQAAPWTTGFASAWYFLTVDPTPFVLADRGTFRGLPSTFAGPGLPGLSLVAPMVVYSPIAVLPENARGIATLSITFVPEPRVLLLGATAVFALLLSAPRPRIRGVPSASP
ncbi:MAG: hypothetical protein GY937_28650 [bacterium]|nr:hypothetical protein [bacterium]